MFQDTIHNFSPAYQTYMQQGTMDDSELTGRNGAPGPKGYKGSINARGNGGGPGGIGGGIRLPRFGNKSGQNEKSGLLSSDDEF